MTTTHTSSIPTGAPAEAAPIAAPLTVIPGDGIGPEIMKPTLELLQAAGAALDVEYAEAGTRSFERGVTSGVPEETVASVSRTGLVLKGPLMTPIGSGGKSANVTLRKLFETFANIRPVREMPGVPTPFAGRGIDVVIVRENVEDLYAGIEHMQTPDVAQCLKLISRLGSQRVVRTALEFARAEGRTDVVVATKANIMKMTEGMLQREFAAAAVDYPDLNTRHVLVDNCAHLLVRYPESFDVIVTSNMNGDILSDLTSGLVGGLGFAPSANLGTQVSIFEAVHGSAPDIAGLDIANPSALLMSAIMMLRHIGQFGPAETLEQALLCTLADGIHTGDVTGGEPVSTSVFAAAIGERIGRQSDYPSRTHRPLVLPEISREAARVEPASRLKMGVDVFIETAEDVQVLAQGLERIAATTPYRLSMISNRGTVVWPNTGGMTECIDHFRCRFIIDDRSKWSENSIFELLQSVSARYRWMHVEKLEEVDGVAGYSRAQGER